MNQELIRRAISDVISGHSTLHAAAKAIGIHSSNLRYWLMKNPEAAAAYAKLQAEDPSRKPLNLDRLDTEELSSHPAVLAVVKEGMAYAKASEKFNIHPMTLHGWVKKLYPDGIGRSRGRRRIHEPRTPTEKTIQQPTQQPLQLSQTPPTSDDHTAAVALTVAKASIQAAATVLGLTYHQVLAKLLEQAPAPTPATAAQPVAQDNSL